MPDVAAGAGDGRRRPTQHAGEVTRKQSKANAEATEEEPPTFSKAKIGGAKNILGKSFEVGGATDTSALTNQDFRTVGGVRAEHRALVNRVRSSSNSPVHLLKTLPGWRRHWGRLTKYQVWSWTGLPDTFISHVCKACFDSVTPCTSQNRAITPLSETAWFTCNNCISTSSCCNWLIAYQSHPLEETDIDSIPDYKTRILARQNLSASGSSLEITKSAVIVPRGPLFSTRVELPRTRNRTSVPQPRPTYSKVRFAYEDLAAMEYDIQCKRYHRKEPNNRDASPSFWETEVAMGRLSDGHMQKETKRVEKPDIRLRRAHGIEAEVDEYLKSSGLVLKQACTPTFSREFLFSAEQWKHASVPVELSNNEMIQRLLLWLLPPPKFTLGQEVWLRHRRELARLVITNRRLGKTWMYQVEFKSQCRQRSTGWYFPGLEKPWLSEYYIASVPMAFDRFYRSRRYQR